MTFNDQEFATVKRASTTEGVCKNPRLIQFGV